MLFVMCVSQSPLFAYPCLSPVSDLHCHIVKCLLFCHIGSFFSQTSLISPVSHSVWVYMAQKMLCVCSSIPAQKHDVDSPLLQSSHIKLFNIWMFVEKGIGHGVKRAVCVFSPSPKNLINYLRLTSLQYLRNNHLLPYLQHQA